ncbi:wax ester/triacylglycerol synthase domain-containing protein [Nocardia sp. NPDC048505]|uniref:wax ester/triacylglycerol synthase domain-containing protein n=1 Tax=unclassified Nocardia TaxID=2637762 RepID=UPI0033D7BFD7
MYERHRVAAPDATMYWLSQRTRNDLFLLYAFRDRGVPTADLRAQVLRRVADIPGLRVRLRAVPRDLDYPSWVPCAFASDQFVEHPLPQPDWPHLQAAVGDLLGTGVDAADRPWRLHLFRGVAGAPMAADDPCTVVVLQMSHALADGRHGAALARALFGAEEVGAVNPPAVGAAVDSVPGALAAASGKKPGTTGVGLNRARSVAAALAPALGVSRFPVQAVRTLTSGYRAYRAQRELAALSESGRLPGPAPSFAPSLVNPAAAPADSEHRVRMLVFDAAALRLPDRTVTVAALTAVSVALSEYLAQRGRPVERSGAQVPMALPGKSAARNHYRSLGVDLHLSESDLTARSAAIAADQSARRVRATHPLLTAQDAVTAVTPALLLRRDVAGYPLDTVPDALAGHTVVSSVHRGPADLTFGGPSLFTAGFPAIGTVMHLTHGVHGLGDTVTISIHADSAAMPDIDAYADLLRGAVARVTAAHLPGDRRPLDDR